MHSYREKRRKRIKRRFYKTKRLTAKEILWDYVENSTVHGIKYLGNSVIKSGWIVKLIWICTLISGFFGAAFMAKEFWDRYNNYPIRRTVETVYAPSWMVPFPAVTICAIVSSLKQRTDFLKGLKLQPSLNIEKAADLLIYVRAMVLPRKELLNSKNLHNIMQLNNLSITDVANHFHIPCEDIIRSCRWQKMEVDCEKMFRKSYSHHGTCCSFNYVLEDQIKAVGTEIKELDPIHTAYFGANVGLNFVIRKNQFVIEVSNNTRKTVLALKGVLIKIHHGLSYPSEEISTNHIPSGQEIHFMIQPSRKTLPSELFSMSEKRRDCALKNEKVLKYFSEYRYSNCFVECRMNATLAICGCISYAYTTPLKINSNLVRKMPYTLIPGDHICDLEGNSCIVKNEKKILALMYNVEENPIGNCSCPNLCEDVIYSIKHTRHAINETGFVIPSIYRNLSNEETLLKFYFPSQTYTIESIISIADEIYILSSLGGIFCLFLGCSFLTIVEILYFVGLFFRALLTN